MFRQIAVALLASLSCSAALAASESVNNTATLRASRPLHQAGPIPNVVDPTSWYSNVTSFTGSAFTNGGSANQAGNTISRLVCDDITFDAGLAGRALSTFTFSVNNNAATIVTARPRVRFYTNTAGAPGTYLTGFSFNAIAFPAATVGLFSGDVSGSNITIAGTGTTTIWACMTFDNNTGATGATLADIDSLGQGTFSPVDRGSSTDTIFVSTAPGSFVGVTPAGAPTNFGGTPLANLGWEMTDASLPVTLQQFNVD